MSFKLIFYCVHIYPTTIEGDMVGRKMPSQGSGERKNHPKWKEGAFPFEERKKKKASKDGVFDIYFMPLPFEFTSVLLSFAKKTN